MRTPPLILTTLVMTAALAPTATATAAAGAPAWRSPVTVPGVTPVIAFGPSGALAVVASQHGRSTSGGGASYLSRRPADGRFGRAVTVPVIGSGDLGPLGVAPAVGGATGILYGTETNGPLEAEVVTPSGSLRTAQRLQSASGSDENPGPFGHIAASADGAILVAGNTELSQLFGATLTPWAATFNVPTPFNALSSMNGDETLVTDRQGDAWIGTSSGSAGSDECPGAAYRAAGSDRFTMTYAASCPNGSSLEMDGLASGGHGDAAMLTSQGTSRGNAQRLAVRIGHAGAFGRSIALGSVGGVSPSGFDGITGDRNGEYTIAWTSCTGSPTVCAVRVATGATPAQLSRPQTVIARVPGDRGAQNPYVDVGDGGLIVEECSRASSSDCTLLASSRTRSGRFGAPQTIAKHAQARIFVSDDHRDLLLVYTQGKTTHATVRRSGASRFDRAIDVPVSSANQGITAAYGPDDEAAVAWSTAHRTTVEIYGS
jgi:hypothetical protein